MSAILRVQNSFWLYPASVACFVAGLMCSESVNLRVFWPDFWVVLSLGLLLTSLIRSVEERVAGEESGAHRG